MHPSAPVSLRAVEDADLPIFFEHQRDPLYDHMAAFTSKNRDDEGAFLAHWAKIRADRTVTLRTIVREGVVVGSVGAFEMFGEKNVTYGVGREHWGQGIATRALGLFLAEYAGRPIFGRAAADNVRSRRVLEKHGFVLVGEERGFANARGEEIGEVVFELRR